MAQRVLTIVGARPNFVKMAPVWHAARDLGEFDMPLVHTGQHYDTALSDLPLRQLGMPVPDLHLNVGSGTHAEQTAAVMVGVERALLEHRADAVLVSGDVNSTMAAAIAAAKVGVPVIHLESGLRSRDWSMPEEVNRVITDRVADLLLCPSEDAVDNLRQEGIHGNRVALVGNTMIDSLATLLDEAKAGNAAERFGVVPGEFALVTLHRPALVDNPALLGRTIDILRELSDALPVILPMHPRTKSRLTNTQPLSALGLNLVDPLGYLDFIGLQADARLVITDSGGVQEETTILGIPCVTFRTTTERPITVSQGTNRLVGIDPEQLKLACMTVLAEPFPPAAPTIPLWDGHAGGRVVEEIATFLRRREGFRLKPPPTTQIAWLDAPSR
jgi:UDP-N-acetylglucosamine 2-epimerase (non-hydrolysing)